MTGQTEVLNPSWMVFLLAKNNFFFKEMEIFWWLTTKDVHVNSGISYFIETK
jgi:hypothetical protein